VSDISRAVRATLDELDREGLTEVLARRQLYIDGVEVTQAIQYYHADQHLTDPDDRGDDNSVRLVANKSAWVRVYVRSHSGNVTGVTGIVEVQRLRYGTFYQSVGTLSPEPPGSVTARSELGRAIFGETNADERGNLRATLNFVIPADFMFGRMNLIVRVNAGTFTDESRLPLNVTLRQTLRLAGILVGYDGPPGSFLTTPGDRNLKRPAPTLADLQATAALTLAMLPVQSDATYRVAGAPFDWDRPLNDKPQNAGECSPNWDALNSRLAKERTNDGNRNDVIYCGLVAAGTPTGPVTGCGGNGVATTASGDQWTMAHEIGHILLGSRHAPCGRAGASYPNYPSYEPYDPPLFLSPLPSGFMTRASIGEYGLNVNNGMIFSPELFKDFMSYCGPQWISLYHHGRLIDHHLLAPARVGIEHPLWEDHIVLDPNIIPERWLPDPPPDPLHGRRVQVSSEPLISLIGIVRSDKEVEVQSVARLQAFRDLPNGQPTDVVVELLDNNGEPLAEAPLQYLPSCGHGDCGCGSDDGEARAQPPYAFQAFLPDAGAGAALRIRRGDEEVWTRHASATPPRIERFDVHVDDGRGALAVDCRVRTDSPQEPEAWLQWSPNEGETWYGLTTSMRLERAELDISTLPSGRVSLRVLAHDGFFTTISDPVFIELPVRPPTVAILNPREGSRMEAGGTLRLWGVSARSSGDPVDPDSARWLIDGEEVARGLDVFVTAPDEGEHRCALIVEADGQTTERVAHFQTISVPTEDRELDLE
jgi:hypothetical protein